MAYKNTTKDTTQALKEKIDDHTKKINEQESVAKFFIIIVAMTLVATLVGIAGLYINAIHQSNLYNINSKENSDLKIELNTTREQINDFKRRTELLKSKYPWIKELN